MRARYRVRHTWDKRGPIKGLSDVRNCTVCGLIAYRTSPNSATWWVRYGPSAKPVQIQRMVDCEGADLDPSGHNHAYCRRVESGLERKIGVLERLLFTATLLLVAASVAIVLVLKS